MFFRVASHEDNQYKYHRAEVVCIDAYSAAEPNVKGRDAQKLKRKTNKNSVDARATQTDLRMICCVLQAGP